MFPMGDGPFLAMRGPFIAAAGEGEAIPTPAIMTGPTWVDDGDGTGSLSFTTDIAATGGIDYGAVSATYTASSYISPATTTFVCPIPDGAGTEFGGWYWRIWLQTAGGFAGYVGSEDYDSIAPVLSSEGDGTPTATGAADAVVTTNCGSGTLYWCLVTNGGSATNAQIIAGTGGNIVGGTASSQAVSATGVQTFDVTGAAASTAYQIKTLHVVQGAESNQGSVNLTTAASFDPADYGDVYAWYQKGVAQTAAEWTDQAGIASGRSQVQAVEANQPTVSGGAVVFGSGSDFMTAADTGAGNYAGATPSVAIRFRQDAHGSPRMIAQFSAAGFADRLNIQQSGTSPNVEIDNGAALSGDGEPAIGTFANAIFVFNGASSVIRFGSTVVTGNAGTSLTARAFNIGAYVGGSFGAEVSIEEIIVWTTAVDAAGTDGDAIIAYLESLA